MHPYYKEQGITPTALLAARTKAAARAATRREAVKAQLEAAGQPSTKKAFAEAAKAQRASLRTPQTNSFGRAQSTELSTAPFVWHKK